MRKRLLFLFPVTVVLTTGCTQSSYDYDDNVVTQTYVHRYGVEVPQESWAEGGADGRVNSTLATGVNVSRNYTGGTLDGETTYTFPHSQAIHKKETYSEGNLAKEVLHYPSGMPMKETQFTGPDEQSVTWWYENSTPRANEVYLNGSLVRGDYYNYQYQIESKIEDGQGTRQLRDQYGLLISTDQFKDGQLVSSTIYYSNGAPKEIIPYANGVISGQKKTFLPGGEPNSVEEWKNGKQNGTTAVFQNGEKTAEVSYVNGAKQGTEKRFGEENTVAEEINWQNNQQHGPSHTYVNGKKITNWYYQGRPVNKAMYDNMTSVR